MLISKCDKNGKNWRFWQKRLILNLFVLPTLKFISDVISKCI